MIELIMIVAAYLIGSIPAGFLVARLNGIADIRQHGSGNIGATNVARLLGVHYFFIVFFLDFAKAYFFITVLQLCAVNQLEQLMAAGALLIGNAFPLFLQFQGGKGVATSVGILSALNPFVLVYSLLVWIPVALFTRTIGKASLVALLSAPCISAYVLQDTPYMFAFITVLSLWGIMRHWSNIKMYMGS